MVNLPFVLRKRNSQCLLPHLPFKLCKLLPILAVKGVTIYISDFHRSLSDKLNKDFFSEPSQVVW